LSDNPNVLIKAYKKRLKKDPNNDGLKLELARLYYKVGNDSKAIYFYEKYYKNHPENIEVAKELGELYLKRKNVYKGFGLMEYYSYTKDSPEALLNLAKNYYWNGFNQEAIDVLNKILKDSPNYEKAKKLKAKILRVAPSYTRSNSGATIEQHLGKVANENLTLAYRLYDNFFYHASLRYFKTYLEEKPNDYKARERYAYALEFSGFHKDAAGEFFLMFWQGNTPILKYHYGYNLMKAGKLKEAKKVFLELKNESFYPAQDYIISFLKGWETSLESLNFNKYKKFYHSNILRNRSWSLKRQHLFKKVNFIAVAVYDPKVKKDKKGNLIVKFYQEYATNRENLKGYKTLTLRCDKKDRNCKIIKERWRRGKYKKNDGLGTLIDDALKYIASPPLVQTKRATTIRVAKVNRKKFKYSKVKDLYFPPEVGKNLEREGEVFGSIYVSKSKVESFEDLFKSSLAYESDEGKNKIGANLYTFRDSDDISMKKKSIYYERKNIYKRVGVKVGIGEFELKKKDRNLKGKTGTLLLSKANLSGGINFEKYSDIQKILPSFNYKKRVRGHNLLIGYKKESAFLVNNSFCMIDNGVMSDSFFITGNYKGGLLWANFTINKLSDGNSIYTPQFSYQLYKNSLQNVEYKISLEGWYQLHSKQSDCYYSPKFADSTKINIELKTALFQNLFVSIFGGIGYSNDSNSYPYSYGLALEYPLVENFEFNAGCFHNSSKRKDSSASKYSSDECNANLNYRW